MPIKAEAGTYKGQSHDCYGVHPVSSGIENKFAPWVHCRGVVYWGHAADTYSEALEQARSMAEVQP